MDGKEIVRKHLALAQKSRILTWPPVSLASDRHCHCMTADFLLSLDTFKNPASTMPRAIPSEQSPPAEFVSAPMKLPPLHQISPRQSTCDRMEPRKNLEAGPKTLVIIFEMMGNKRSQISKR